MLQCGREYGFSIQESNRATNLSTLTKEQLKGLPTGNLKCERHLSVFDKRAGKVAKCGNYKFTGKSIRNDVMLYKGTQGTVDVSTKLVTKLLEKREAEWNDLQKIKMVEKVKEKLKKASNVNNMIKKLLADFSHTHRADKVQRPELYRQNCISQEEKLENLCVLLTDDAQQCLATTANLATNDDGMKALSGISNDGITEVNYEVNQCCVVLWAIPEEVNYEWFIAYIKEKKC